MSITIKQRQNNKWRLLISEEEWEYPDRALHGNMILHGNERRLHEN